MLVLHAALLHPWLALWAERPVAGAARARRRRDSAVAAPTHPFAAGHFELVEALRALGLDDALVAAAETGEPVAWLPGGGAMPRASTPLLGGARATRGTLELTPWRVPALLLGPGAATGALDAVGLADAGSRAGGAVVRGVVAGAALRQLAAAARQAASIVVRQEVVPSLTYGPGSAGWQARWRAAPRPDARSALDAIARGLPASAMSLTLDDEGHRAPPPPTSAITALDLLVDGVVDDLVRNAGPRVPEVVASGGAFAGAGAATAGVHDRWLQALTGRDASVRAAPKAVEAFAGELHRWQQRARRAAESPFRLCVRLEQPRDDQADAPWALRYLLQARDDPTVMVDAVSAWSPAGADAAALRRRSFHAGEHLLAPLADVARLSEPIERSLLEPRPSGAELDTVEAYELLATSAALLEQAGVLVQVPAWWRTGHRRPQVGLRARVLTQLTGGRRSLDSLNLDALVGYDWRVAIGDADLSRRELTELAAQKTPLVQVRGAWTVLDQDDLQHALALLEQASRPRAAPAPGHGVDATADLDPAPLHATLREVVAMSVGYGGRVRGLPVLGVDDPSGDIERLLLDLPAHGLAGAFQPPASLRASLRPYQLRGAAWLAWMAQLGLGACLADDMGLGKTVQALAAIAHAHERAAADETLDPGPVLVVCPTTVATNWAHECTRFTPGLAVLVHHGPARARGEHFAAVAQEHAIVVTTYALLARDLEDLLRVPWSITVLDEAQAIKNPGTAVARAAMSLGAPARIALTGTPVENGVGDLWSIMEYLAPGLLGAQADFRRRYLLPIQTGALPGAGDALRQLVGPFVLRRMKHDPGIADELPDQLQTTEWCTLTTEQASLYEAIVRDAERTIRGRAQRGVDRRGVILATLSRLKQACNHPAHLLGDGSAVDGRSGKLARLEAIIEQVLERGERALVFTQFVAMGELLQQALASSFALEVPMLHGGTSRAARDRMVARFQSAGPSSPPVMVLSLKAGGSGLNLTAANHVVHFDRWWNPATEQQASDRAHRIGQSRDVHVHALACVGTVEERIDSMLRQKRAIAGQVIGTDERWITELPDEELLDLLRLRTDTLLQPGRLDDLRPRRQRA